MGFRDEDGLSFHLGNGKEMRIYKATADKKFVFQLGPEEVRVNKDTMVFMVSGMVKMLAQED